MHYLYMYVKLRNGLYWLSGFVDPCIQYNLNYPEEFVTKITGYFGTSFITSLTFHTNRRRKLGPCGQKQGTYFKTEVRGKIVGIFGSGAARVDSIGVYMLKSRTSKERVSKCDSEDKIVKLCLWFFMGLFLLLY